MGDLVLDGRKRWSWGGIVTGISCILACLVGLVFLLIVTVPTLLRGRGEAWKVQCRSNLMQIFQPAMSYSLTKGNTAFPLAPGNSPRAHESLNEMLAFDQEGLSPKLFKCPEGEAREAQVDEKGEFLLDADTLDYAWAATRVRNTAREVPLASDKYVGGFGDILWGHRGHRGGMNVLWTDGSVRFVKTADLQPDTGLPPGLAR